VVWRKRITNGQRGEKYPACNRETRKANWIVYCLLKHTIEGKYKGQEEEEEYISVY
jgi:hypothetical protein